MITINFPDGRAITIPGATEFHNESGVRVSFFPDIAVKQRALKLSRNEKYEALTKWGPAAWKACKGDVNTFMQSARDAGFYSQTSGDMQLLWTVMKELGLYPKEAA